MPDSCSKLTIKQAAEHLGVSEKSIRRRIADGSLPAYRVGPRSIRVQAKDVDALLAPIPTAGGAA